MTFLRPLGAREGGWFVRFVYWMTRRRLGRVPQPIGVMAHHRAVLAAVGGFELAFEKANRLQPQLRELAQVKVATLVGCRFCIDIGSSLARKRGVTREQLLSLPSYDESSAFSQLERNVLDYAVAMTAQPSQPHPDLFARLQRELGDPALVELTAAIAWENFRARFNHAVGATEEGFSDDVACLLPAHD